MDHVPMKQDFGCERCWPATVEAAWEARGALTYAAELIDEPHFHVMILACPACGQRFVSIFTEMIDWQGGDDAQEWILMPVTAVETADLIRRRASLTEESLGSLGRGRRCLRLEHPTGATQHLAWTIGASVGAHD